MRGLISMRAIAALMMAPASEAIVMKAAGGGTTQFTEDDMYKRLRANTPRRLGQTEEQYEWNLRVDARKLVKTCILPHQHLSFNDPGGPITESEGDVFIDGKFIGKATNLKINLK